VYINSVWAASLTGWTSGYITVPVTTSAFNALKSNSKNTIAIHCKQTAGGQYIDAGISVMTDNKLPTSINQIDLDNAPFNFIYPNPVKNSIHFSEPFNTPVSVAVFNTTGQSVKIENNISDQLDMSNLNSGFYYIKVIDEEAILSYKILKL
jgi:hypothetical protein